jgi:hypothetical protein
MIWSKEATEAVELINILDHSLDRQCLWTSNRVPCITIDGNTIKLFSMVFDGSVESAQVILVAAVSSRFTRRAVSRNRCGRRVLGSLSSSQRVIQGSDELCCAFKLQGQSRRTDSTRSFSAHLVRVRLWPGE